MKIACLCFECAKIVSCPFATGKIKQCKYFLKSRMSNDEVAKILDTNRNIIQKLKQTSDGLKYLCNRLKKAGYDVRIDKSDNKISILRKEKF